MKYFILIIILFISLAWASCSMCGNKILEEKHSPNGYFKLIKFDRDCGATTTNSIQVSLIKSKSSLPNVGGNVFISDYDFIAMSWINDKIILIKYRESLNPLASKSKVRGVAIEYEIFK
jgi:hypothetical protein